jgi:mRNA-degrading endonuclease RelE of RelBE toxin-antitoxin system
MEYLIRIKPSAEKALRNLPKNDYYKVLAAFSAIAKDPFSGKKLQGEHKSQWSMRVWPYRVIYSIIKKELLVLVISIGHRQGIY